MGNMTACVVTAIVAFVVTSVLGIVAIPALRRLKFGQTINEIGPTWHQKKQGTPTMGGLMFVVGILVAVTAGAFLSGAKFDPEASSGLVTARLVYALLMALGFCLVGFLDDYIKVVRKQNLGLSVMQKIILQLAVSVLYLYALYLLDGPRTDLYIPFLGTYELGWMYYPLAVVLIVGFVNAVNLTDGVDGLASSVTFVAALGLMVISTFLGAAEMNLLSTAMAGGCLGFLVWNLNPAKVFMGDTGSMFLGGLVVAITFGLRQPLLLVLVGIIYVVEAGSVILQVLSFKLTGKRIFKMSPIHHHFEMSGFSETKIVVLFSLITLLGSALGFWAVFAQ